MGLIPDGLRRWSTSNGVGLGETYLMGANRVADVLLALQRLGVRTVTVYNLSRANLARRDEELEAVYAASVQFFTTLIPARFDPAVCAVRLHGDRALLPENYLTAALDAENAFNGQDFTINMLAAYDARDELRNAFVKAKSLGCDVNDAFDIGEVDLVIRTSPEPLLSGFLPMQCQYAQLRFLATPLIDLQDQQLDELVADYRRTPQLHGK
ncbi:undecaprenyl diphosphate synthase family protein [Mycobacterium yunnanensis]|uniref:(2Z,6E)-farnesyl diphosphate synthase n=1 Tax=Mycobacterium yunnanensis TaxID=368477 RepID=A0A9X2Z235_9MYCO|nr:undecaprenyl diphosphate synthase family protein [Mycobacterium yunnanensis]